MDRFATDRRGSVPGGGGGARRVAGADDRVDLGPVAADGGAVVAMAARARARVALLRAARVRPVAVRRPAAARVRLPRGFAWLVPLVPGSAVQCQPVAVSADRSRDGGAACGGAGDGAGDAAAVPDAGGAVCGAAGPATSRAVAEGGGCESSARDGGAPDGQSPAILSTSLRAEPISTWPPVGGVGPRAGPA